MQGEHHLCTITISVRYLGHTGNFESESSRTVNSCQLPAVRRLEGPILRDSRSKRIPALPHCLPTKVYRIPQRILRSNLVLDLVIFLDIFVHFVAWFARLSSVCVRRKQSIRY